MGYEDLRHFINVLEKEGELLKIQEEVDWDIEAGAISRKIYELEGPCILFENVKDYPAFSILNGPVGTWKRVAIAMGMNPNSTVREIYAEYEKRIDNKIPPKIVARENAPCKENIFVGDQVDLNTLPAPMVHEGDGGRYIGTWDLVVSKDPDTEWTNWGMYRFMVHNERFLAGWPQSTSQLALMMQEKYLPENKPMPVALVIGAEPLCHMVATAPVRPGVSEAEVVGGLRNEPVDLVKCETSDLMVPAHAEIVIEGEIPADSIVPDGPFGEYPGYRSGTMAEGIAFKVKAITYRNNPILTMTCLGYPVDCSSISASLTAAVGMKKGLQRRGVPVTDVYVPPEGVTHLIIVGVEKGGAAVTRQVLDFFTARRVMTSKHIVVDKDVDVFNMSQVLHAFATKCHPGRGILLEHYEGRANALTPFYNAEERRKLKGVSVAFDSTWPPEWSPDTIPPRASFEDIFSEATKNNINTKWNKIWANLTKEGK